MRSRSWLATLFLLSSVPIPISAKPDTKEGGTRVTFRVEKKSIHWVHGLIGTNNPDVAEIVKGLSKGYDRIAGFRVTVGGGFHDWLITHLTGTLVRMKTVVIEGVLERDSASPPPTKPQE